MPQVLTDRATERGTFIVTVSFEDEDGTELIPDSLTYTLTDGSGNVVNSKEDEVLTPAASVDILLSGLDLDITNTSVRVVTVEGTYTSDAGAGLPLTDQVTFHIDALEAVP